MDIVYIRDLKIETVIGIFDWERRIRQTISLDLEMAFDIRPAAASDNIADALDYKAVAKRLIGFVESAEFLLVETLAEQVAALCLDDPRVRSARVRVEKLDVIPDAAAVGVEIERTNPNYPME